MKKGSEKKLSHLELSFRNATIGERLLLKMLVQNLAFGTA